MFKKQTKKKVLVVEDEQALRFALKEKLEHKGFTALTAQDGEEGLKIGLDEQPDLILLDIIMPRLDGLEMLKAVRADKAWGADVPVIVLTNSREKGNIVEAMDGGVSQYLTKADWKIEDVIDKVREALDERGDGE